MILILKCAIESKASKEGVSKRLVSKSFSQK